MNCTYCKRQPYLRSSRRTVLEYLGSAVGVVPVRCRLCRRRNVQILWVQMGVVGLVLAVGLGCAGFGYKQVKARVAAARPAPGPQRTRSRDVATHSAVIKVENVLRNNDVVRLKKAGMGNRVLVRLIESTPGRFLLDANEVIALKDAGVDDEVIDAMIGVVERSPAPPTTQASVPTSFTQN